jgi:hypothetical protein
LGNIKYQATSIKLGYKINHDPLLANYCFEIFNRLAGPDKHEISTTDLHTALARTGKFTEEQARYYIEKLKLKGHIYERRPGFLART